MAAEEGQVPRLVEEHRRLGAQTGVGGIGVIQKPFVVWVEVRRPAQCSPLR
jgi:hypothetical protein